MDVVAPLYLGAAVLLILSGYAKLVRPQATAQAFYGAGLRTPLSSVRVLGAAEVLAGAAGVGLASRLAAVSVAVFYAAFAAFVAYLLTSGRSAGSCGCAGARDLPPSWLHVTFNVTALAAAVTAAIVPTQSMLQVVVDLRFAAVPFLLGLCGLIYACYAAVVYVPGLMTATSGTNAVEAKEI